jgi:hypothetical protein
MRYHLSLAISRNTNSGEHDTSQKNLQTWQDHGQPHEYSLTHQNMHLHGQSAINAFNQIKFGLRHELCPILLLSLSFFLGASQDHLTDLSSILSLSLIDASICYSILLVCFRLEDNRVAGGQDLEEILGAALLSL